MLCHLRLRQLNILFLLLETLSVKLNQRLVSLFWSIWKHHNLRVWDNVTEVRVVVVERANNLVSDIQFDNVDFETDSKLTCDAFHATRDDYSEFG